MPCSHVSKTLVLYNNPKYKAWCAEYGAKYSRPFFHPKTFCTCESIVNRGMNSISKNIMRNAPEVSIDNVA